MSGFGGQVEKAPWSAPWGVQRGADEGLALNDPNPIVHNRIFVLEYWTSRLENMMQNRLAAAINLTISSFSGI